MDNRGVTPVVEKALTAGLVVLFVGRMTATLFGGAVPTYRAEVGAELGERVLATAAERVEEAVPRDARSVAVRHRVDLPSTIHSASYRIRTDGRSLVLDHPNPAVGGRSRLALPSSVTSVDGEWRGGSESVVAVESADDGLEVTLREGSS